MNSWIPLTCVPTSNYVSFKPCFQIHLFMSKEFKELKCDDFKGQSLENIYHSFSLLLLLSCFSPVWLCATPETTAHQAPLSLGFSIGVGCHFLLQCMKVKSEREVTQSCLTLPDPMDCSLPGSYIHGIFQARVLEWGAITFPVFCKSC